jgi:uracil-DNA glycosylase family 4
MAKSTATDRVGRGDEPAGAWDRLNRRIVACQQCPRLIEYCQAVAAEKRRAYVDWTYWGRPVPNFGAPHARLLVVGLAPAAHGANRTGRLFTGDRSGEWLYRALYRAGFANQPESNSRDDGLVLFDAAITATCHCAPPANRPTPEEIDQCHHWFTELVALLPVRVFVALGQVAWRTVVQEARQLDWLSGRNPKFGHGAVVALAESRWLIGSYHPSQQNTFTGRLTEPMFDSVFARARELLAEGERSDPDKQ